MNKKNYSKPKTQFTIVSGSMLMELSNITGGGEGGPTRSKYDSRSDDSDWGEF